MDDERARELRIEERYPDGKAGTGFNYIFSTNDVPDGMIMFEIRLPQDTIRLFFSKEHFTQFAKECTVVADTINTPRNR